MPIRMGPNGHEVWSGKNKRPIHGRSYVTRHGVRFTLRHGPPGSPSEKGASISAESNPVMEFRASWDRPGKGYPASRTFRCSRAAARFIKKHRANGVKVRAQFSLCAGFLGFGR